MTPQILVDCDGVLADFLGAVLKYFPGRRQSEFEEFGLQLLETDPTERAVLRGLEDTEGFCSEIEWYDGAQDFLRKLQDYGEVVCVTAPWFTKTWEAERREWLKDFLPHDQIIFCPSNQKHRIRGHVIIDDRADTCAKWLKSNSGYALTPDRPWNRNAALPHNCHRMHSYSAMLDFLTRVTR